MLDDLLSTWMNSHRIFEKFNSGIRWHGPLETPVDEVLDDNGQPEGERRARFKEPDMGELSCTAKFGLT